MVIDTDDMTNAAQYPHRSTSPSADESSGSLEYNARSRADLIIYIRHVLGFIPQKSIVLVAVENDVLSAVLRVNLPPSGCTGDQLRDFLTDVVAPYQGMHESGYLLMVVFDDDQLSEENLNQRHQSLITQAVNSDRSNPCITDVFCATPQQVWGVFPEVTDEEDISPEALEVNPLTTYLTVEGFSAHDNVQEAVDRMRTGPWPRMHAIRSAIKNNLKQRHTVIEGFSNDLDFVRFVYQRMEKWEYWINRVSKSSAPTRHDKDGSGIRKYRSEAVNLVTDLAHVRIRDLVLLLAHFEFPTMVAASSQHYLETDDRQTLLSEIGVSEECMISEEAWDPRFLSKALTGSTDTAPCWERNSALNALLRELLPIAGGDSRQAILGILGWLEWTRGRSSLAMAYLDKAIREDSNYRFTQLFRTLLSTGKISEWATRRPNSF